MWEHSFLFSCPALFSDRLWVPGPPRWAFPNVSTPPPMLAKLYVGYGGCLGCSFPSIFRQLLYQGLVFNRVFTLPHLFFPYEQVAFVSAPFLGIVSLCINFGAVKFPASTPEADRICFFPFSNDLSYLLCVREESR